MRFLTVIIKKELHLFVEKWKMSRSNGKTQIFYGVLPPAKMNCPEVNVFRHVQCIDTSIFQQLF
jgi:hypothetical protein